jgi:hypothetical protein
MLSNNNVIQVTYEKQNFYLKCHYCHLVFYQALSLCFTIFINRLMVFTLGRKKLNRIS